MYYTTNPAAKAKFVRSLRELADYLDRNPGIPVPKYGERLTLCANATENGGRTQVDHIARLLGADITDDTARGGHYWAARTFGGLLAYEIVSIPELAKANHRALMSYDGSVIPDYQPDTWT